jgi:hypothetical protein
VFRTDMQPLDPTLMGIRMPIHLATTATTVITIVPTLTTEGYSSVAAGTAEATDLAEVDLAEVDLVGVDLVEMDLVAAALPAMVAAADLVAADLAVAERSLVAVVAGLPEVVEVDSPEAEVDTAVGAGSRLLPSVLLLHSIWCFPPSVEWHTEIIGLHHAP